MLPTGTRGHCTYERVAVEDLPPVPGGLAESIAWLTDLPAAAGSILESDQPERSLGPDAIAWLEEQGVPRRLLPAALIRLGEDPTPLAAIRSPTACFVDLGSNVVPVGQEAGGGWLIRFVSDSQVVLSWLIHLGADGTHRIVATPALLGYDLGPAEIRDPYPIPDHPLSPTDLSRLEVEPCASSLSEFLARLWLEAETWWSLHGQPSGHYTVIAYEQAWRARFP